MPVRTIAIHPYTAEWLRLFEAEKLQLHNCLGNYVLDIQHVGSTAVLDLPAKPTLDIGVVVTNFEEAFRCIPLLEQLSYVYQGELGIPCRHYFVNGGVGIGSARWSFEMPYANGLIG